MLFSPKSVIFSMSTPLFYACEGGYEAFAKFLLEHGAEVDLPTKNQVTPLFAASQAGATPIVRLLLRQGANPLLRATPEGALPLYVACLEGHLDVAKELVCFPPGPEGQSIQLVLGGYVCVAYASGRDCGTRTGMYVNVDLINEEGLQRDGNTALMACCERGHKEIVEFLLDNGAGNMSFGSLFASFIFTPPSTRLLPHWDQKLISVRGMERPLCFGLCRSATWIS